MGGLIERIHAPNLFTSIERALVSLNSRLEPIERVRRFTLLATGFPAHVYHNTGAAKVRRDRPRFLDVYAARSSSSD